LWFDGQEDAATELFDCVGCLESAVGGLDGMGSVLAPPASEPVSRKSDGKEEMAGQSSSSHIKRVTLKSSLIWPLYTSYVLAWLAGFGIH
jgi:hypothetical protein